MKYYIQTSGFNGDAMLWWRPEAKGYTMNIDEAGKYSAEEAEKICNNREDDIAWPCDYIDNHETAKATIVTQRGLDYEQRKWVERK